MNTNINNKTKHLNKSQIQLGENTKTKLDISSLQSPKITTDQKRTSAQPKWFSQLDINYKTSLSKGISIPEQYQRRSEDEQKAIFSKTRNSWTQIEHFKHNLDKYNPQGMPKNKENCSLVNLRICVNQNNLTIQSHQCKSENTQNTQKNWDEPDHKISTNPKHIKKAPRVQTSKPMSRKDILYGQCIEHRHQRDKWMPRGFERWECNAKNAAKENMRALSSLPMWPRDMLRKKMYSSDIFFQNNAGNSDKKYWNKSKEYPDHQDSDIFHIKNNAWSISKSGEKNYFKKHLDKKYSSTSESHSQWHPKNLMPTLLNHSSTSYHPWNEGVKHFSKTKDEIVKECREIDPSFNIGNKQKSWCEFIDLSRVNAKNPNANYLKAYCSNPKAFCKRNDICSEYYDIFGHYRNICEKPFANKAQVIEGSL